MGFFVHVEFFRPNYVADALK